MKVYDITTTLMGGQVKHIEFKSFYIRRPFEKTEKRQENEYFFERLAKKIHERNLDSEYPKDDRSWNSITINAGIFPSQRDEANLYADYLVSLKLIYLGP